MTERIAAGFVPLVDCAVLATARECGFAKREGFELELVKEPSWASLRDHLSLGHVDCAHALAALPIASTLGVGHVQVDCIVPFVLNRGGNAITVSTELFEAMRAARDADLATPAGAAAALAAALRRRTTSATFGMVFPFSSHNFDLRYWLASAGVHPDRDVRLVAIPPPLMVEHLRAGHVDGFCVGEPWNSLAVAAGLGVVVATQAQLFAGAAEKVLAVRASLEADPERLAALLRALDAAAAWADDPAHRAELAALLARAEYLDVPAATIAAVLSGAIPRGTATGRADPDFIYFHRDGANVPSTEEALWSYAQMIRWGQLPASPVRQAAAARVFRADLYRRFVGEPASLPRSVQPFDRIAFTPEDIAGYLRRIDLATPYPERSPARDA